MASRIDQRMWFIAALIVLGGVVVGLVLVVGHEVSHAVAIHAALMLTAWGALIPLGGIVARYYKVTPRQRFPQEIDNLFWWRWHQRLQYSGVGLSTLGLSVILSETGGHLATAHGWFGIVVMSTGWLQIVSTLFRGRKGGPTDPQADPTDPATWRGDHYDMTRRRVLFETWHKCAGWIAIGAAGVTVLLGIALIGSPVWLVAAVGFLQSACVLGLLDGRLRQRWVDTYEAIWGLDPIHPGHPRTGRTGQAPCNKGAPAMDPTSDRGLS